MKFQKKHCVAMLLAGGQGSRLMVLTQNTAKPAVPYGGKYRIIDFPLSNCVNSGIDTVGILTQYQPLELNEYIGNGQPWNLNKAHGGVQILPPYARSKKSEWYKGCLLYTSITGTNQEDGVAQVIEALLKDGLPQKAYTYIVKCADGSLYTGWTNDLNHRLQAHNTGKGAKYTKARLPVSLAYYEAFLSKEAAMRRESQIKKLPRKQKLKLIGP